MHAGHRGKRIPAIVHRSSRSGTSIILMLQQCTPFSSCHLRSAVSPGSLPLTFHMPKKQIQLLSMSRLEQSAATPCSDRRTGHWTSSGPVKETCIDSTAPAPIWQEGDAQLLQSANGEVSPCQHQNYAGCSVHGGVCGQAQILAGALTCCKTACHPACEAKCFRVARFWWQWL